MQRDPKSNHAAKLLLYAPTKWRRTIFFTTFLHQNIRDGNIFP